MRCSCTTHPRVREPDSGKVTLHGWSHPQTAKTPSQCRQSRCDVLGKETALPMSEDIFFLVKVLSGTNITSSLNMKTFKNISLCMCVRVFQTNLNHKENVEYRPRELFWVSLPLFQYTNNISAASKLSQVIHLYFQISYYQGRF